MIIDCISDLHGEYPILDGGDLLIVAGDIVGVDNILGHSVTLEWLHKQDYRKKVVIGGNHDNFLQQNSCFYSKTNIDYLCDSGTQFEGLKIWGMPWTLKFSGINPHCCAFTCNNEEEMVPKIDKIPTDVDILITHMPPYGILDKINARNRPIPDYLRNVGSKHLYGYLKYACRPLLHVFGHIHEGYGALEYFNNCLSVNASLMNEYYDAVNDPIRVEIDVEKRMIMIP